MSNETSDQVEADFPDPEHLSPEVQASLRCYWRSNVKVMVTLLVIWAVVGIGCGVLFADALNEIKVGGYPVGFWFAQQGSIAVFVVLILVYAIVLNRLDAKHHAEIDSLRKRGGKGAQ